MMVRTVWLPAMLCCLLLAVMLMVGCAARSPHGASRADLDALVDESARAVLALRLKYPQLGPMLADAQGLLVFPAFTRAGYFVSVSGGSGVYVARDEAGFWSAPMFRTMGGVGGGMLAGAEHGALAYLIFDSEVARLVARARWKADARFGVTALTTTVEHATDQAIALADFSGVYAGVGLEGAYVDVWTTADESYHGVGSTPESILAGGGEDQGRDRMVQAIEGPLAQ
ncbi:MAG: hypothetical protein AB7D51_12450 [Desulfovibrionaceae bacterium]